MSMKNYKIEDDIRTRIEEAYLPWLVETEDLSSILLHLSERCSILSTISLSLARSLGVGYTTPLKIRDEHENFLASMGDVRLDILAVIAKMNDIGGDLKIPEGIIDSFMCHKANIHMERMGANLEEKYELYQKTREKSWAEREVEIASAVEDEYGKRCYMSALKAYRALIDEDHSGMTWTFTCKILEDLCKRNPLTPIEESDDIWDDAGMLYSNKTEMVYQCKRMSSLFKHVNLEDGSVRYSDVNRVTKEKI